MIKLERSNIRSRRAEHKNQHSHLPQKIWIRWNVNAPLPRADNLLLARPSSPWVGQRFPIYRFPIYRFPVVSCDRAVNYCHCADPIDDSGDDPWNGNHVCQTQAQGRAVNENKQTACSCYAPQHRPTCIVERYKSGAA